MVQQLRLRPWDFLEPQALAQLADLPLAELEGLSCQHYHLSLEELALRARLEWLRARLLSDRGPAPAELEEPFLARYGLSPRAYQELADGEHFSLQLPPGYPLDSLRQFLTRDPHSRTERLQEDRLSLAVRLGGQPQLLRLELGERIQVRVDRPHALEAHQRLLRLLGLAQPCAALVARAEQLGLARLTAARPELRLHQSLSAYEGLLWTITGQQINLGFAFQLKGRLMELAGTPVGQGLYAPPTPRELSQLDPERLRAIQYSRQKADYLLGSSRLVADGLLDLEQLAEGSATQAERSLLAVRGLGTWSVNYLMMRSLGFADCLPVGDTGVASGLRRLFGLAERPSPDQTRALMLPFAPYRSLATAHLWQIT